LRHWLNRPNCPAVISQFKALFDSAFSTSKDLNLAASDIGDDNEEHARYSYKGVTFSKASVHYGNSLILYYPSIDSTVSTAGSIQKIQTCGNTVRFHVRRQAPLPAGSYDPFARYPALGAKTYARQMLDGIEDIVGASSIICHVARWEFSSDRCVVLSLSKVRG
jgi:hypothetical protein